MKVDDGISSVMFTYPFLFPSEHFEKRIPVIESAEWEGRERAYRVWENERFPEYDLLPHVAKFLNPPKGTAPTARLWALTSEVLQSSTGGLGGGGGNTEWYLETPKDEIGFQLQRVQLIMFRVGVGFITVRAAPVTNPEALDEWLDFLHQFRFAFGQRKISVRARRRVGFDREKQQQLFSPFFPRAAGGVEQNPEGKGVFGSVLNALLHTGDLRDETSPWWRECFIPGQLIPFSTLFVDDIQAEETPEFIYRVRHQFHAKQQIHPPAYELSLSHSSLLEYAANQWFVFGLDGGAFVACDAPHTPFFREVLPDHLRRQYALLFFLTLHQRFGLTMLSEEVARHWIGRLCSSEDDNVNSQQEKSFERIRCTLLEFMARGYFSQAMQKHSHHLVYRKWQEVFQMDLLFQEICGEVELIYNHFQQRRARRLNRLQNRLNLIALLIGVPALALTFMQSIGVGELRISAIVMIGGLLLGIVILRLINSLPERK